MQVHLSGNYIPVVISPPNYTSLSSMAATFLVTCLIVVLQPSGYSIFHGGDTPIWLGLLWQSYSCQCLNTKTSAQSNRGYTIKTLSIVKNMDDELQFSSFFFILFTFLFHFIYFSFSFLVYFLFLELRLGLVTKITPSHDRSHQMTRPQVTWRKEGCRRFWKNDVIQHVEHMLALWYTYGCLG